MELRSWAAISGDCRCFRRMTTLQAVLPSVDAKGLPATFLRRTGTPRRREGLLDALSGSVKNVLLVGLVRQLIGNTVQLRGILNF